MDLLAFLRAELQAASNPDDAAAMRAYLKTDMPMFGVKKPVLKQIFREAKGRFKPGGEARWREQVQALWAQPEREWKYLALSWARQRRAFIHRDQLDLFERMVREGAWWDLVDEIAVHLIGEVVRKERAAMVPVLRTWLADPHVWIRRTALLAQLKHRDQTDADFLFEGCARLAPESSFWIRKAIGWALREYSRTDPEAVHAFVAAHEAQLSGLSKREALRRLNPG